MWISAADFSELTGLTNRQARRIFSSALIDGHHLDIRAIPCPGGTQKEVWSESLPAPLQQRLRDLSAEASAPETLRVDEAGLAEHNWKLDVIRPILAHDAGSSARAEAYNHLIGTSRTDWTGRRLTLSKSSLYRWVGTYEDSGGLHLCLAKSVRKDKGKSRVTIRKEWDLAVPFDAATCEAIRHEVKQYLRSLIKVGGTKKKVLELTSDKLREVTALHGANPDTVPAKAFVIPLDFFREERRYQKVYRHKKDRKASHDAKPRIQRTTSGLLPMDIVVMDVHHINVLLERENGKTATAKLLAFHDIATSRVFCEIIMFEKKGGVRNADIITAFINMCMDPAFGMPKVLYVDNGSEYGWADHLKDALKLNISINGFDWASDRSAVVRAIPYNASAKQVEGWFRQMNQQYFRHIPGWIDDDRMNPKRESLGKPMPPYPGTFDEFSIAVKKMVYGSYGWSPQYGELKGLAPLDKFRKFRDDGWTATILNPDYLLSAFTREETRKVTKGGIQVFNRFWTCDELIGRTDERVTVHIPKYHGFERLRVTDGKGDLIGFAEADTPYDVMDPRGAQESARRGSLYNDHIAEMDKSVSDANMMAELIAWTDRRGVITPNTPDAVISVNGYGEKGLMRLPIAPPEPQTDQQDENEARAVAAARAAVFSSSSRKAS